MSLQKLYSLELSKISNSMIVVDDLVAQYGTHLELICDCNTSIHFGSLEELNAGNLMLRFVIFSDSYLQVHGNYQSHLAHQREICIEIEILPNGKIDFFCVVEQNGALKILHHHILHENSECSLVYLALQKQTAYLDLFLDCQHRGMKSQSHCEIRTLLKDQSMTHCQATLALDKDLSVRAHYSNHNLILGGTPVLKAQPNLEIESFDVQCTHGVTVGALDHESLFYLMARGLEESFAHFLLVKNFLFRFNHITLSEEKKQLLEGMIERFCHSPTEL